jgi:acetoin utilization deacetylase AcuC-like enzyme
MASMAGVAGALYATDLVVQGDCVNAFCATRPPGHHAGRNLHSMKAVSNGFCVLNPVASAAIYATSSISNGGLGMGRVCVIDFDVHHGTI